MNDISNRFNPLILRIRLWVVEAATSALRNLGSDPLYSSSTSTTAFNRSDGRRGATPPRWARYGWRASQTARTTHGSNCGDRRSKAFANVPMSSPCRSADTRRRRRSSYSQATAKSPARKSASRRTSLNQIKPPVPRTAIAASAMFWRVLWGATTNLGIRLEKGFISDLQRYLRRVPLDRSARSSILLMVAISETWSAARGWPRTGRPGSRRRAVSRDTRFSARARTGAVRGQDPPRHFTSR